MIGLIDRILPDLGFMNPRNCYAIVYLGSCRVLSVNSHTPDPRDPRSVPHVQKRAAHLTRHLLCLQSDFEGYYHDKLDNNMEAAA